MNWTEIKINIPLEWSDTAAAIANMTVPYGIYIEDYSDLETAALEIAHIDLIDEELIKKDRSNAVIHIYIPEEENAAESIAFLKERLAAEGIPAAIDSMGVDDSGWNENWKKYFHATEIGRRLAIVPSWEKYENSDLRTVLNIDPGAAFGTGTHATTSLCLETLEGYAEKCDRMLDIGTGSGILAIAAALLGAREALGVDIDPQSVKTAKENALINGVEDRVSFCVGDLADKAEGKYDLVCANIVADVIIKLLPDAARFLSDEGVMVISGIIDTRKEDVLAAVSHNGFRVKEERYKDNWCAFVLEWK